MSSEQVREVAQRAGRAETVQPPLLLLPPEAVAGRPDRTVSGLSAAVRTRLRRELRLAAAAGTAADRTATAETISTETAATITLAPERALVAKAGQVPERQAVVVGELDSRRAVRAVPARTGPLRSAPVEVVVVVSTVEGPEDCMAAVPAEREEVQAVTRRQAVRESLLSRTSRFFRHGLSLMNHRQGHLPPGVDSPIERIIFFWVRDIKTITPSKCVSVVKPRFI